MVVGFVLVCSDSVDVGCVGCHGGLGSEGGEDCLDRMGLSYGAMGGLLWVITVTGTSGLRHVLGINRTKSDRIGLPGTGGF